MYPQVRNRETIIMMARLMSGPCHSYFQLVGLECCWRSVTLWETSCTVVSGRESDRDLTLFVSQNALLLIVASTSILGTRPTAFEEFSNIVSIADDPTAVVYTL